MKYSKDKADIAQYVLEHLIKLKPGFMLTTIIRQDASGVCSVDTVTNEWSGDFETMKLYAGSRTISYTPPTTTSRTDEIVDAVVEKTKLNIMVENDGD